MRSLSCVVLLALSVVARGETKLKDIVPKPGAPFAIASKAELPALEKKVGEYMSKPPQQVRAHPAAQYFPGAVRSSERVSREVEVKYNLVYRWTVNAPNAPNFATSAAVWQETGLYAAPGEIVVVTVDGIPSGRKLTAIVGCHLDTLFGGVKEEEKPEWRRFPSITRGFDLSPGENRVANAFGGQIFLRVSVAEEGKRRVAVKSDEAIGKVRFANAVTMPTYVEGKDDAKSWKLSLESSAAPWGTLVAKNVILHLPRAEMEKLGDPAALLAWWNKAIHLEDDLIALQRHAPERIVPDAQIDAGYMHSGYPFMCFLDPSGHDMCDLAKMKKEGDWGFFHELGHNHQNTKWTFVEGADQGEVTCNFFALYCMNKLVGIPIDQAHDSDAEVRKMLAQRLSNPPNLEPFQQLAPFQMLLRAHGWEPLRETLRSYAKPLGKGIQGEPALKNLFVQRYGEAAKSNVAPFFAKLGYPITPETHAMLSKYPVFEVVAASRKK